MQPTGFGHFCQPSLSDCYDCYRNRVRFADADMDGGNHSAASVAPKIILIKFCFAELVPFCTVALDF